jgi:hypothetical protein
MTKPKITAKVIHWALDSFKHIIALGRAVERAAK